MKKLSQYLFIFIVGISVGILVWANLTHEEETDSQNLQPDVIYHASDSMPVSREIRQVNSQNLADSRRNVITEAVSKVSPAVVGINVIQIKEYQTSGWIFEDPFFRHFFPEKSSKLVKGLGSGFIISPDGYIITNEHVVHMAKEIVVSLPNGKQYDASLIAADYISDVALLKIEEPEQLPYVNLGDSDDLIIGEWAIAIGNPFGLFDMGQPSVSQGIISATDRDFGQQKDSRVYKDMIQTDAAINSGNSGGPLVNSLGEVVGINTFIFSGSEMGATSIGLGFATPINRVKKIIRELRTYGKVNRKFKTGLEVEDLTINLSRYLGLESTDGAIISNIEKNSPADNANLQIGDVIIEINGYKIKNAKDPMKIINNLDAKGGDILTLKIIRRNKIISVPLKLEMLK